MGSRTLSGVQYGKEGTHGTAVAADTILYCRCTLPDSDRDTHIPSAELGRRTPRFADIAIQRHVIADGITLEDADGAYFDLLPLMFSMCLDGNVTATEQSTSQTDYLWTFTSPQTGSEDVDSITLEVYDDTQAYEVAYVLARSLNITGDCTTGECHVSADCFGDRIIQTTKTALTTYTATELLDAKLSRIYIDDAYSGLGGTELTGALVNWAIDLNGGVHPKFLGSSSRLFDSHGQDEISGTVTLTFERTSAVATEELKYRPAGSSYATTLRALRLAVSGTQIGSGDNHLFQYDMMGVWTAWQPIAGDTEGNTYDVATMTMAYDDTSGSNPCVVNVKCTTSAI